MTVERIPAITIKVNDMAKSVHFYNKLLGLKILCGGGKAYFSSLQTLSAKDTTLNLEQGQVTRDWGRIIFHVEDIDKFWAYLKEKEFNPDRPREMPHGAKGICTCTTQMATNCHWRNQSGETARFTHTASAPPKPAPRALFLLRRIPIERGFSRAI